MILGIGSDIVDIRRIEKLVARFGERFLNRVFTSSERAYCNDRPASLAKRFAAKEAMAKALGCGIGEHLQWKEAEVFNLPSGKPSMRLLGSGLALLATLTGPGKPPIAIHLSLSDEYPYAQAFIVIAG